MRGLCPKICSCFRKYVFYDYITEAYCFKTKLTSSASEESPYDAPSYARAHIAAKGLAKLAERGSY